MQKFSKSISVFRKAFLLLLFPFMTVISMAQGSFSDQTVFIEDDEFMPYCQGEIRKHFEGEKSPLMEKIYRVLTSWDSLKPPKGFEASFNGSNNVLDLTFAAYVKQNGSKTVKAGATLSFFINDPVRAFGSPASNCIYLQPERVADFYGCPVYQTTNREVTIISKNTISLFVPVTQGEFLQQLIDIETGKQHKDTGDHQKSDYEQVISEMEKAYKELLKTDPSAAAEFKAEIQKFKSENADSGTGGTIPFDLLTSLKKELDNLSPAERDKPARYSISAFEKYGNFSGLIPDAKGNEATALIKLTPEFSNLANEKNVLKLLVITWNVGYNNSTSDKPRLFDGEAKGFGLADYHMAILYRQQKIWESIIDLVH